MRQHIISLLLAAALLMAGCASEEQEPTTDSADDSPDTVTGNTTDDGPNSTASDDTGGDVEANNTAPVATLEASALNGTAPLNVTFTLDGSDADGDNLTWTLALNGTELDAGDMLPAQANVTFDQVGDHMVELTISDGQAEGTMNLTISVRAPQEAEPAAELQATWTGLVWDPTCFAQDYHDVPQSYWGMEYRVTEGWHDGMYMDFWDASIENGVGTSDTQVGIIPEDAGTAWLCLGESMSPGEYTIEIWG